MLDNIDYKILQILADSEYHSGEKLAREFNATRAAICKRVAKLNDYLVKNTYEHLNIISITGKGYRLNQQFDALNPFHLIANLPEAVQHSVELSFEPILNSTNDYLINTPITDNKYHICIAEQQIAGKGRNTISKKKSWYSPFGTNIYCSIAWHYQANQNSLLGLSLVVGITIAEVINSIGCTEVQLKWPNDILINQHKVAGILTEIYGEPNGGCKLVIGFGINVHNNYSKTHNLNMAQEITQPWTTIAQYTQNIERNKILAELIKLFMINYQSFIENGLKSFIDKWQQYDCLANQDIRIDLAGKLKYGKYIGIDHNGALLAMVNGEQQTFHSGEVSVGIAQ